MQFCGSYYSELVTEDKAGKMTEVLSLEECLSFLKDNPSGISKEQFEKIWDAISFTICAEASDTPNLKIVFDVIECLRETVRHLFDEMDSLRSRLKQQETLATDLLVGQLTSKLEKEIVAEIFRDTDVEIDLYYVTLIPVEIAFKETTSRRAKIFLSQEQKEKAAKNWDHLEELLGLDVGIYGAIENMKVSRNALAHPDLPLEELSKCLEADKLSLIDEGMCDRFIEALNKLSVKTIGTHAN